MKKYLKGLFSSAITLTLMFSTAVIAHADSSFTSTSDQYVYIDKKPVAIKNTSTGSKDQFVYTNSNSRNASLTSTNDQYVYVNKNIKLVKNTSTAPKDQFVYTDKNSTSNSLISTNKQYVYVK